MDPQQFEQIRGGMRALLWALLLILIVLVFQWAKP